MRSSSLALAALSLIPTAALAQQTSSPPVQRDPQAIAILTQALSAAGGVSPSSFSDFKGTGTITYFWAGEKVLGKATVRGRGVDQFRLDADMPDGKRSYAVSHGRGNFKDAANKTTEIPYHNTINAGIPIFPYPTIAAALSDPLTDITYIGLAEVGGRQVQQVRVQRTLPPERDPHGVLSKLMVTNYFTDSQTGLVVKISDKTHPVETLNINYLHDFELENYKNVNGINVPTVVREKIDRQLMWELHLETVSINAGLNDADFSID